jgi:hypothetical protein
VRGLLDAVDAGEAVISIDMLTTPAINIAMVTSMSSKRKIRRLADGVAPTTRRCVRAECR